MAVGKGFEIAEGYLSIDADTDGALKDVRAFLKQVDGELTASEKQFRRAGEGGGEALADGASEGFQKNAPKLSREIAGRLRDERGRFVKAGDDIGRDFTGSVGTSIRRGIGQAMDGAGDDAGRSFGRSLLGGLARAIGRGRGKGLLSLLIPGSSGGGGLRLFAGLAEGASKFFSTFAKGFGDALTSGFEGAQAAFKNISSVFSQIGSVASGLGGVAQVAVIGALIPLVLGLAGALLQLSAALFALPAAIGVLLAIIAPLIIAFKGFGEAVGAGLSGDVQKFNEALKGLAPSAQKVAREFVALGPALKAIKQSVQGAFFAPLVGAVKPLATTLLPALNKGLTLVAGLLGQGAAALVKFLSSADALKVINDIFSTTARILTVLGPALGNLFSALFGITDTGLPFVERFFGAMARGINGVAAWLNKIRSDGTLNRWLERAWDIGKKLWAVLKGLGQYAVTLLNAFGDEGTDTLNGMANALKKMNDYLKSDDGAETLHNLGVIVHWAGNAFVFLLDHATTAWRGLNAFFAFIRGIGPFFSDLGHGIADIARAVGGWFAGIWHDITGFFSAVWSAVTGFFSSVGDGAAAAGGFFSDLWSTILDGGSAVLDWLTALPGQVGAFFTALPGMVWDAVMGVYDAVFYMVGFLGGLLYTFWTQTFPGWISQGWTWVTTYVQEGVQGTLDHLAAFPGQAWAALSSLGSLIGGVFSDAWHWALQYTIEGAERTWARISAFPGQAWAALSSLGSTIGGLFRDAWDAAVQRTISGVTSVVSWAGSLPGKLKSALSDAGHWLYSAGQDAIRGLVNGIEDALGWAVDMARRAANQIKKGFLDALDIGSPSRVMRVEVGRQLLPGVRQGIDDSMPDMQRYLGGVGRMLAGGFNPNVNVAAPNVNVGGTTLIADLGEGIRQVVPLVIMRNPRAVAGSAAVGNQQRDGWVNTGRGTRAGSR